MKRVPVIFINGDISEDFLGIVELSCLEKPAEDGQVGMEVDLEGD